MLCKLVAMCIVHSAAITFTYDLQNDQVFSKQNKKIVSADRPRTDVVLRVDESGECIEKYSMDECGHHDFLDNTLARHHHDDCMMATRPPRGLHQGPSDL